MYFCKIWIMSSLILCEMGRLGWQSMIRVAPVPGGGYSLCDGWYICAAVLTPFFHFGRIEHDLFGVLFLIHQQQSYLLGYKNYQFLQKSIFLAPNSIFSSIFLGPIFSGQRHTPIRFQAEYPPPPRAPVWKFCWVIKPVMIRCSYNNSAVYSCNDNEPSKCKQLGCSGSFIYGWVV